MHNLLTQIESDLNAYPSEKMRIMSDVRLAESEKTERIAALNKKQSELRELANQYMRLRGRYAEIKGTASVY